MKQDETRSYWVRGQSFSLYLFIWIPLQQALRHSGHVAVFVALGGWRTFFPGASGGGQGGESHSLDVSWLSKMAPLLRLSRVLLMSEFYSNKKNGKNENETFETSFQWSKFFMTFQEKTHSELRCFQNVAHWGDFHHAVFFKYGGKSWVFYEGLPKVINSLEWFPLE